MQNKHGFTLIKAKTIKDSSITGNTFNGSIDSLVDADTVDNVRIEDNLINALDLEQTLENLKSAISSSGLESNLTHCFHSKIDDLKREKTKQSKLVRYKELMELINLHKDLLTPVYPYLERLAQHAYHNLLGLV